MGDVRATVRVYNPNNNIKAGDIETGYCYAQTSASYTESMSTVMDGDWEARTVGLGAGEYHACQISQKNLETFRAVWQYSHFNVLINKHEYQRNSAVCTGKCQPERFCATTQANWAMKFGVKISVPVASYCQFAAGTVFSATQPSCKQSFGWVLGGWDGDCN